MGWRRCDGAGGGPGRLSGASGAVFAGGRRRAEWVAIREHLTGEALVATLDGAAVIVAMRERTRFDRENLRRLPDLKLLITTGMQNASIDLQAAAAQGVVVSGTGGPRTSNTAELTWALILALVRHLPEEADSVRDGGWQRHPRAPISSAPLFGLVGLGRIGHQMARIGQAFGMDVIAWSQNLDPAWWAADAGVRAVSKADLFAGADVVSVHLMLSDRTRGLMAERELRAMKPTAYLINTSRGPIIDAAALLRALNEGWIAGAGLDVYGTEPLPVDDPLRRAPRTGADPAPRVRDRAHHEALVRGRGRGHRGLAAGEANPPADPGLSSSDPGLAWPGAGSGLPRSGRRGPGPGPADPGVSRCGPGAPACGLSQARTSPCQRPGRMPGDWPRHVSEVAVTCQRRRRR